MIKFSQEFCLAQIIEFSSGRTSIGTPFYSVTHISLSYVLSQTPNHFISDRRSVCETHQHGIQEYASRCFFMLIEMRLLFPRPIKLVFLVPHSTPPARHPPQPRSVSDCLFAPWLWSYLHVSEYRSSCPNPVYERS